MIDDFGQGPFADPSENDEDFFAHPEDPLYDPLLPPQEDPNADISNPMAPYIDQNFNRFDYSPQELDEMFEDNTSRNLGRLEDSIEGSIVKAGVLRALQSNLHSKAA